MNLGSASLGSGCIIMRWFTWRLRIGCGAGNDECLLGIWVSSLMGDRHGSWFEFESQEMRGETATGSEFATRESEDILWKSTSSFRRPSEDRRESNSEHQGVSSTTDSK